MNARNKQSDEDEVAHIPVRAKVLVRAPLQVQVLAPALVLALVRAQVLALAQALALVLAPLQPLHRLQLVVPVVLELYTWQTIVWVRKQAKKLLVAHRLVEV